MRYSLEEQEGVNTGILYYLILLDLFVKKCRKQKSPTF